MENREMLVFMISILKNKVSKKYQSLLYVMRGEYCFVKFFYIRVSYYNIFIFSYEFWLENFQYFVRRNYGQI